MTEKALRQSSVERPYAASTEIPNPDRSTRVTYRSFDGTTYSLNEFKGRNLSILIPDDWLTKLPASERRQLLDRSDWLYDQYKDLLGSDPPGTSPYTIAFVLDTCGYGCAGGRAVEIASATPDLPPYGGALRDIHLSLATGHLPRAIVHEMAHTFDIWGSYLGYVGDSGHAWTRFIEYYILHYAKSGGYDINEPQTYNIFSESSILRFGIREGLRPYLTFSGGSWDTCIRQGSCQGVASNAAWGGLTLHLARLIGPQAMKNAFRYLNTYAASNPAPDDARSKSGLFFEALSEGAQQNMGCAADQLLFEISSASRARMQARFGSSNPICEDKDLDGYSPVEGDTDDARSAVHPGAADIADGLDNDSDEVVDDTLYTENPDVPFVRNLPVKTPARIKGYTTYNGYDGDALQAGFLAASAMVFDAAGNLYIADAGAHVIRMIKKDGQITTVAGKSGVAGTADGPGPSARLNGPTGLAFDRAGNLYIADGTNRTIRRLTTAGKVETVAGKAEVRGTADGQALSARFLQPYSLAFDAAGNLLIVDYGANTIRKLDTQGNVTTVVGVAGFQGSSDGTGTAAMLAEPLHIAATPQGNFLIADGNNRSIRMMTPDYRVTTVAGDRTAIDWWAPVDGVGRKAHLMYPTGIAVDSKGIAYFGGPDCALRSLAPDGTVTTIAGVMKKCGGVDGPAAAAGFNLIRGVAVNGNDVYIAEAERIRRYKDGAVSTFAGAFHSFDEDRFSVQLKRGQRVTVTGQALGTFTGGPSVVQDSTWQYVMGTALRENTYREFSFVVPETDSYTLIAAGPPGEYEIGIVPDSGWKPQTFTVLNTVKGASGYRFGIAGTPDVPVPAGAEVKFWVSGAGFVGSVPYREGAAYVWTPPAGMADGPYSYRAQIYAAGIPVTDATDAGWFRIGAGAATPALTLAAAEASVSAAAGTGALAVHADAGATWPVISTSDWVSVTSEPRPSGDGIVTFAYAANPSASPRTAQVIIGGELFTIRQAGFVEQVLTLAEQEAAVTAAAGTGTITVHASAGMAWSAASGREWVTIASGAAGSGDGVVTYTYTANPSPLARSAQVTVGGLVFTIRQSGAAFATPAIAAVANPWSTETGITPGAAYTIYGSRLGPAGGAIWAPVKGELLATMLPGTATRLNVNGVPAPLLYVRADMVNFLVPNTLAPGPAEIVVEVNGVPSEPFRVEIKLRRPAVFGSLSEANGTWKVAAVGVAYEMAGSQLKAVFVGDRAGSFPVERPARPGDLIDLYVMGLGPTSPNFGNDRLFAGDARPLRDKCRLLLGGTPLDPVFAGMADTGYYVVRFTIPETISAGPASIAFDFGENGGVQQTNATLLVN